MNIYFAPMEGLTDSIYRRLHHEFFPGVDCYFTPFFSPTVHRSLTAREERELPPAEALGCPVVPQLLTKNPRDFLWMAGVCRDRGYQQVNLNLGCPSGTVVAKKKGSGFLGLPEQLDVFFDQVFSAGLEIKISVKTRVGLNDPDAWPDLAAIFDRYPISLLIVHPRIRRDFYREPVRLEAFQYAADHIHLPLCYNGDLNTPQDCQDILTRFPTVDRLMLGRGLVANPALVRELAGGPALTKNELLEFFHRLTEAYRQVLFGDHAVLGKCKELWFYTGCLFTNPEKYLKAMRKAKTLTDFTLAVDALFRDQDLKPGGHFSL